MKSKRVRKTFESTRRFTLVSLSGVFAFTAIMFIPSASLSAQFTTTIPKFPMIKKEKPQTTTSTTDQRSESTGKPSAVISTEALLPTNCKSDPVAESHLADIGKTRKEAEDFKPGSRDYFVSTLSDGKNLYLEAALSPFRRKEWLEEWPADFIRCMDTALDGLAAAARKTLPGYTGPAGYTFGTPAEKQALLGSISDIDTATVFKVGIKQANWLIAKDNFNFPIARYKHGVIWAKYPKKDHGFCQIYWVNLKQDYAGGGTYGASYGYLVSRALAGCPN